MICLDINKECHQVNVTYTLKRVSMILPDHEGILFYKKPTTTTGELNNRSPIFTLRFKLIDR